MHFPFFVCILGKMYSIEQEIMFIINKVYLFLVIFYFFCPVFELSIVIGDLHAILYRTYCGLELVVVLLVPLLVCFCQGAVSHTLWLLYFIVGIYIWSPLSLSSSLFPLCHSVLGSPLFCCDILDISAIVLNCINFALNASFS